MFERLLVVLLFLFSIFSFSSNTEKSKEVIKAVKTDQMIKIDGQMEDVWKNSKTYTDFVQLEPFPFEKPAQKTEFKILYNEENIFFFIKAYDNPNRITTIKGKRDINQHQTDWIKISLDPLNEKTTAYAFLVNPSNVQNDFRIYNGGNANDIKWDAIWESATNICENCWTAEFKIPLNILKFQNEDVQDWGINIGRHIYREQQESYYQIKNADAGYLISNYAKLAQLENLKSNDNLIVTPTITSTFDSYDNFDPSKYNRTFGADIKYNLNSTNTLMMTIIPDFAQIEADPDIINISDYPVYLREKRPFFLEGNELFYTYDENYYSRRMAKPKVGLKFLGSTNNLDYGIMYIKNERENDGINNLEDLTVARVKFGSDKYKIGYLGGFVNSKYNLSGQLHNFDLLYQATDQLELKALFATTLIDGKKIGNNSTRFQAFYRTEKWNIFTSFQKKSPYFEQGLLGYPEANNTTEIFARYQRTIKFKESSLTRFQFNIGVDNRSLYNNKVDRTRYLSNFNFRFNFPTLGIINVGTGLDKIIGYSRFYEEDGIYQDNYGSFNTLVNDHFRFWCYLETDASKTFSAFARIIKYEVKMANTERYDFELTYKPNASFRTTLGYTLFDIARSQYIDERSSGLLSTLSLKTEYSITDNIFLKLYTQFNSQSDRLSNNIVLSYEYLRGNFVYLAYADTGFFDSNNPETTYLKKYKIERRTISLKWSYALYL